MITERMQELAGVSALYEEVDKKWAQGLAKALKVLGKRHKGGILRGMKFEIVEATPSSVVVAFSSGGIEHEYAIDLGADSADLLYSASRYESRRRGNPTVLYQAPTKRGVPLDYGKIIDEFSKVKTYEE